jgi:hypothetical protein
VARSVYTSLLLATCSLVTLSLPSPSGESQATHVIEPLLVDLGANGFQLTSAADGVQFDLDGEGTPRQMAWTAPGVDDAFLALDTTRTGRIENGRKLLGGLHGGEIGFTTLRKLEQAGHADASASDAAITESDAVFGQLILWIDSNHDGIAEGDEMRSLASAGMVRMFFGVTGINQPDAYGNVFHYSARALVRNRYGVPVDVEVRSVRFAQR